jgi:hypothetical protein
MSHYRNATVALIFLIGGCADNPAVVPPDPAPVPGQPTSITVQNVHASADRPGTVEGDWSADVRGRAEKNPIQLSFAHRDGEDSCTNNWRSDTPIEGLLAGGVSGPAHFGLRRSPGGLTFDGGSDGNRALGIVRFEPDVAYASEITRMYGPVSAVRLFELAVCGLDIAFAQQLYQAGYRFSLDETLLLFRGNVTADYAIELKRAGYDFSFGEIMHLYRGTVSSAFAKELRQGGMQFSAEDLILLSHSGVSTDYAIAMRHAGVCTNVGDVIYLKQNSVSADYARELAAAGYKFTAAEVAKLHHSDIGASYAAALKKADYNFNVEEIIRLRRAGVDADFAAALIAPGHEILSADDLLILQQRGVDVEMVRKLRK